MNAPAKQTTLAEISQPSPQVPQRYAVALTDSQGFELVQRAAKLLAASQLVPKEYQGNLPNCVIALNMAQRIGADPLMIMQNLIIVHGKPTWSSQFLIATVNTCGRFSALRYEFFGERGTDDWGCCAWAIEKATGEKLVGTDITIAIAKKEGWYGKNGSKWQSIPQQMLMYRAGAWWCRVYAPELSMGLQTADEAADIIDINPDGTVARVTRESLRTNEMHFAKAVQSEKSPTPVTVETVEQDISEIHRTTVTTPESTQSQQPEKWEPSIEELAEIRTREMAEANTELELRPRVRRERAAFNIE